MMKLQFILFYIDRWSDGIWWKSSASKRKLQV